ncbi:MAG: hypothetical protein IKA87_02955 [Lentisphaeria bacterium]|nr:hypothetical protein [Lentisphaeria bacterium]
MKILLLMLTLLMSGAGCLLEAACCTKNRVVRSCPQRKVKKSCVPKAFLKSIERKSKKEKKKKKKFIPMEKDDDSSGPAVKTVSAELRRIFVLQKFMLRSKDIKRIAEYQSEAADIMRRIMPELKRMGKFPAMEVLFSVNQTLTETRKYIPETRNMSDGNALNVLRRKYLEAVSQFEKESF